ncbi:hypothetical protein CELD12_28850 [Cellulomonas sp. NTE-D12]|nr:hypothetical protein CELD12_28850 [Cellulomonas sp. NTE-D12]
MTTGHDQPRILADWTPRIGPEAAVALQRAMRYQHWGLASGGAFVLGEVWSQIVRSSLGVAASAVFFLVAVVLFVIRVRLTTVATRSAGVYLGLTPYQAKYVPLRFPSTFDMWISKRNHPDFPRVTRFS